MRKKGNKILTVAFLGLALLGTTYFMSQKTTVFANGVEKMERMEIEEYDQIKQVDIHLSQSDMEVVTGDQKFIEINYPIYKNKKNKIIIDQKGELLNIYDEAEGFNKIKWSFFDDPGKVTLVLPREFPLDKLNLTLDMGSMEVADLTIKESNFELKMGSLKARQSDLGLTNADLKMGEFKVDQVKVVGDSKITLSMGDFVGSLSARGGQVDVKLNMGSARLDMIDGNYNYETKVNMGSLVNNDKDSQTDSKDFDALIKFEVNMGSLEIN